MKLIDTIKKVGRQVKGFFPSPVPVGRTELNNLVGFLKTTYRMPTTNDNDIYWVVTNTLMHMGPSESFKPRYYFVKVLNAAASKQVAAATFQEIKIQQQEAASKAAAAAAEATATASVASDVPIQK